MSILKYLGGAVMAIALVATTSYGYLLENSFFDDPITWDDGLGWERFGDGPPVTQEDWASGAPGEDGFFGVVGDGNSGVAHRGELSTGGGFVQVVPGIVPGAEYYLEISSHAGCDSPGGNNYPTTSVFNIDFEWYDGDPDNGGSEVSTAETVIDPKDGGCDGGFPAGYSDPGNWDTWFITNTAPAGATHMRLTIKWDGSGTNSVGTSAAVRWDNALLTTSALDPLNETQGLGDVLRMTYNTQSALTYKVESAPDLNAGFVDAGLPEVVGNDGTQEVYFVGDLDANAYRLKVGQTPVDTSFTVHPYDPDLSPNWAGYMTVFELNWAYAFGEAWGVDDLVSDITAATNGGNTVLTLGVNSVNDTSTYWYVGGGAPGNPGNKIMDANLYNEYPAGELAGETVTFSGTVLANTLSNSHTAVAFIKDFAPGYGSNVGVSTNLVPGPFSISLTTDPGAGRHVQYGFTVTGPCVWITDAPAFGDVQIAIEADTSFIPDPVETGLTLDTSAVVSWDGQLGVQFQPEYSDDAGTNWMPLGSIVAGDGTTMQITDPAGMVSGRIYRVVRTPTATPPPST